MQRHRIIAATVWVATSAHSGQANAASPTTPVEQSSNHGATSSAPSPTPPADAEALYSEGRRLYEAGQLHEALQRMLLCYERTHAVNLLFNLALIYRALEDCPNARDFFQRYVQEADASAQRDSAGQQFVALNEECPAPSSRQGASQGTIEVAPPRALPTSAPEATPAPKDTTSPPTHKWTAIGWTALSAGVLTGAGATYFAVEAAHAQQDAHGARTVDDFDARSTALSRDSTLAWVLGGTSLAALGIAAYALVVAAPGEKRVSGTLRIVPSPNAALIDYWLRF